jgi:diaminopimelate epimerase
MNFTKLQATGNDFIFVDARSVRRDWSIVAREICNRYLGVGADGLIIVENSNTASFKMRLFNSDGSEAEVSGNGLRCFAKYVIDRKMVQETDISVETISGVRTIEAKVSRGLVTHARVNMGSPHFKAKEIPIRMEKSQGGREVVDITLPISYPLKIDGATYNLSFVSVGNPHAITFLSFPVADFPLTQIGPKIENHHMFPQRINFEVARVLNPGIIEARVWERGAGETLSCGSGACAIAVVSKLKGFTDRKVDVMLTGGELTVTWDGVGHVYLAGPVEEVFTGEWPK